MLTRLVVGRVYAQLSEGQTDYDALRRAVWRYGPDVHYIATTFNADNLRQRFEADAKQENSRRGSKGFSKRTFDEDFPLEKFVSYREMVKKADGERQAYPVKNLSDDGRYGLRSCVRELTKGRGNSDTIIILPTSAQLMTLKEFAERDGMPLTGEQTCTTILCAFNELAQDLPEMKASVIIPVNTHDADFGSFNRSLFHMTEKIL